MHLTRLRTGDGSGDPAVDGPAGGDGPAVDPSAVGPGEAAIGEAAAAVAAFD